MRRSARLGTPLLRGSEEFCPESRNAADASGAYSFWQGRRASSGDYFGKTGFGPGALVSGV
jgi:hypothetical protein